LRNDEQNSELCIRVGHNIRIARESKSMTQKNLATLIGSTQSQIGKYERGEQDMSLSRLIEISEALNINTIDLLKQ